VSRKTKPWPSPRPIPTGVSFGTYHEALFRAVREFLADVKRAEREAHEEVENIRKKLGIPAVYQPDIHVERYSMAVQVLVAMTLEGAIDLYGVVKFGEGDDCKTWKWFHNKGPGGKLQEMIKAAKGIDLDDDAEILQIVKKVFKARNAFVHPKSDETVFDDAGNPLRVRTEHLFPGQDGNHARAAYEDLSRFLRLLHDIDPDVGVFIYPW